MFRVLWPCLCLFLTACALWAPHRKASDSTTATEPGVAAAASAAASAPTSEDAVPAEGTPSAIPDNDPDGDAADEAETAEADSEDDDEEGEGVSEEGESTSETPVDDGLHYTADLSDQELQRCWKDEPEKLGSISLGFVDQGRLINAQRFPAGPSWIVISPEKSWATQETIQYVVTAIEHVKAQLPDAPPLRVNQLSGKEGGYLRPHKSHQNGRDVDLAFYYPTVEPVRIRNREKHIDLRRNWTLLKALITMTDVQFILVDRRIQKVIYDYALQSGENKPWLDSVFRGGKEALIKHARRHRDHFHVRFYNGRAQELGRRVAPLLAQRPEQNITVHKVRSGDTLGGIARRYGTTIILVKQANRLKGSFLRLSQQLKIPLRGPCTRCPVPPPVLVPDRRLPPTVEEPAQSAEASHPEAAAN